MKDLLIKTNTNGDSHVTTPENQEQISEPQIFSTEELKKAEAVIMHLKMQECLS